MPGFADYDPDAAGRPAVDAVIGPMLPTDVHGCAAIASARENDLPGARDEARRSRHPVTATTTAAEDPRSSWPADRWAESFERKLTDPHTLVVVARVGGEVVAYGKAALLQPVADGGRGAPDGWYLTGLVVSPVWRRRGLGRQLTVSRLECLASVTDEVWYFAAATNRATIDLHTDLGFCEATRDFAVAGVTFTGGQGILYRRPTSNTLTQWVFPTG